jgi:integrase
VHVLELLEKNPVLRKFKPKPRLKSRKHLPPKQLAILLEKSRDHPLGPAIWLESLAGLRTEAIQALTWSNVDFDRGVIHIRQAYKRKLKRIEPYPKGRDQTTVPLPRLLADYLREVQGKSRSKFVAPNQNNGILDYDNSRKALKKFCSEIGFNQITLHVLRHSCSELWMENGANIEDVRRLLNHKSSSTTIRYIHRTDSRIRKIAEKIEL